MESPLKSAAPETLAPASHGATASVPNEVRADGDANPGAAALNKEVVEPIELLDDHAEASWRQNPRKHLFEVAQGPMDVIILDHFLRFDEIVQEYFDKSAAVQDLALRIRYREHAMKMSEGQLRIYDTIRKYQTRGRQEVIVKHQTVRTPQRRAQRSPVARSAETAKAGGLASG